MLELSVTNFFYAWSIFSIAYSFYCLNFTKSKLCAAEF